MPAGARIEEKVLHEKSAGLKTIFGSPCKNAKNRTAPRKTGIASYGRSIDFSEEISCFFSLLMLFLEKAGLNPVVSPYL